MSCWRVPVWAERYPLSMMSIMMIQPILFGSAVGPGGSPFFNVPARGADLLHAHIFDVTFISAAPGTGAALSWILFLIMLLVTLALFATGKLWVFYGSD